MKLEKNYKNIYVVCPPNFRTGGVELLHQLIYTIKKIRSNVFCVYDGVENHDYKVLEEYQQYIVDYLLISEVEDSNENLLIIPEITVSILNRFKKIEKAIYWESVDNFFFHNFSLQSLKYYRKSFTLLGRLKEYAHIIKNLTHYSFLKPQSLYKKNIKYNFCQSDYALQKCIGWKLKNVYMMTDYLNDSFLTQKVTSKKDIVIYNPAKGFKITKKIIAVSKNIEFVPLQNMTRDEIKTIMSEAKVYIDFGNHPGKDRLPRETAISGCCIITGTEGSASRLYTDVFIPDDYKFDKPVLQRNEIISRINTIFRNYDIISQQYSDYRNRIKNEHIQFEQEVKEIFS